MGEATTTLEARLSALVSAGAERVDPASLRLVTVLLARGSALGGGAEARLRARAEARLEVLAAAIDTARAAAEAAVKELARTRGEEARAADADLAATLGSGDPIAVAREARRRLAARARAEERVSLPWLARIRAEARVRGLALAEEAALAGLLVSEGGEGGEGLEVIVTRGAQREAQARGRALSAALFRESAARARAELAVAQAFDNAPAFAGPYNPQVLSARALAEVAELCPGYLRALIAELDDLAGLKAALAPAKAERRAGKGRAYAAGSRQRRASRSAEEPEVPSGS